MRGEETDPPVHLAPRQLCAIGLLEAAKWLRDKVGAPDEQFGTVWSLRVPSQGLPYLGKAAFERMRRTILLLLPNTRCLGLKAATVPGTDILSMLARRSRGEQI